MYVCHCSVSHVSRFYIQLRASAATQRSRVVNGEYTEQGKRAATLGKTGTNVDISVDNLLIYARVLLFEGEDSFNI